MMKMIGFAMLALAFCVATAAASPAPSARGDSMDSYGPARAGARNTLVDRRIKRRGHFRAKSKVSLGAGLAREIRHAGRPAAWCGWWLGKELGLPDRMLWKARNWATVGSNAGGPRVGAIVVWRHHVGIITGQNSHGWVVKSGNDGHAVRERARSVSGAIAFRSL